LIGLRIVVCADDIILVTSSVSVLQKALEICQRELQNLDMSINATKKLLRAHWPAG